jgi:hypothetical protein
MPLPLKIPSFLVFKKMVNELIITLMHLHHHYEEITPNKLSFYCFLRHHSLRSYLTLSEIHFVFNLLTKPSLNFFTIVKNNLEVVEFSLYFPLPESSDHFSTKSG